MMPGTRSNSVSLLAMLVRDVWFIIATISASLMSKPCWRHRLAALASICRQDFPTWQVVFGVQDPADTALPVVRRLQARFPDCDIAVVVDPTGHGRNPKVANLISERAARKVQREMRHATS